MDTICLNLFIKCKTVILRKVQTVYLNVSMTFLQNYLLSVFLPFYIVGILSSGCSIIENEQPKKFESYLKAEINGKLWKGDVSRAVISNVGGLEWLNLYSTEFDSMSYPYNTQISFTANFDFSKKEYKVVREQEENGRTSGGMLREMDGDAVIALYDPVFNELNHLSINLGIDEDHGRYVTGSFSMQVVVWDEYDYDENNNYRKQPDTVYITNGKYKVLLEE